MVMRNVKVNDCMDEYISDAWDVVCEILEKWLDENVDVYSGEPNLPDLYNDLDYDGSIHEAIDSNVPIYTSDIKDLVYLYEDELNEAFDYAGICSRHECDDWRTMAIYCYMEQEINSRYYSDGQEQVNEWWQINRPVSRALNAHELGEFEGLVVNNTSDVPDDYVGEVLDINDHGNATLYKYEDGESEEIDAVV